MKRTSLFLIYCLAFTATSISAQNLPTVFTPLVGDNFINSHDVGGVVIPPTNFLVTSKGVYSRAGGGFIRSELDGSSFKLQENEEIVKSSQKTGYPNGVLTYSIVCLTSKGRFFEISLSTGSTSTQVHELNVNNTGWDGSTDVNGYFRAMEGDDFYFLTTKSLIVTRDNFQTYQTDTAGLGSPLPVCLGFDTLQNIYAGGNTGLYKQAKSSSVWSKVTGLTATGIKTIYADRRLRLYAATSNAIYKSLNNGTSWTLDTAGLFGARVYRFTDDKFGNIYAITSNGIAASGNGLFKYNSGTSRWLSIHAGIYGSIVDTSDRNIFNAVSGDSILTAATTFGLFISRDQGSTWQSTNNGVANNHLAGFTQHPSSKNKIISCNLGIFVKRPTDTAWNKTYPLNGFMRGQNLFLDKSTGTVYTTGYKLNPGDAYNSPRLILKSTDGGLTWTPDTSGISSVKMYSYFVDENGNQYAAGIGLGTGPISLFVRKKGQSWQSDNAGFTSSTSAQTSGWGSDGVGNIYLGLNSNMLWKRNSTTNTWILDTAGISNTTVYDIAVEKNGTVLAGAYDGLYHKSGSIWSKIPNPPGTPTSVGNSAFVVTVDTSGAIWSQYSIFDANFVAFGSGVYFSKDHGVTWTNARRDTTTFQRLIAVGDTVYGVSYYNGLYVFTKNSGTAIHSTLPNTEFRGNLSVIRGKFQLEIPPTMPTPFVLSLSDVSGRTAFQAVFYHTGLLQVGTRGLKEGVYFYRLRSSNLLLPKK